MNDLINIENKILVIRGQQVMLDRDLAVLYGVETKVLNQAVKRNIERFPEQFMFQLDKKEQEDIEDRLRSQFVTLNNLKSQIATSSSDILFLRSQIVTSKIKTRGGRQYLPYAFTEQGVAMLSAVLRSETAVKVSIDIMNAFVAMRHYLHRNADLINRVNSIENKIDTKIIEYDENFSKIFKVIDFGPVPINQGVFVQGQIYDAYTKFQELIQKAKKEIILIDNYIDLTVLDRLTVKSPGVDVIIYTQPKTPIKKLDIAQFNAQYPTLTIKNTTSMHDRFLIIDRTEIYHIGASLKDLGKKCFGFTRLEEAQLMIKTVMDAI